MDCLCNTGIKGLNQQIFDDGAYFISFKSYGEKYLSICYPNLTGSVVRNDSMTRNSEQCFIIKYNYLNNDYSILSLYSHQFLGAIKKVDTNYLLTTIAQHETSDEYLTKWKINLIDNTYFYLELKDTELRLEYDSQTDLIQLNKKSDNDQQKTLIKPIQIIENGFYTIKIKNKDDFFLSFSEKVDKNNSIFLSHQKQLFWIQFDSNDGCYSIINTENNLCLSSSSFNTIKQSSYQNFDCQKWIISSKDVKKGEFFFELKTNFFRLNVLENHENSVNLTLPNVCNQLFQLKTIKIDDKKKQKEIEFLIKKANELKNNKTTIVSSTIFEINDDMFSNYQNIETFELPLSILKISENAFKNLHRIKTISCDPKWLTLLPNPLNVERILVPQGIEKIDKVCFNHFHNLKFLSLPESLKVIDSQLFSNLYDIRIFEGDLKFLNSLYKKSLEKVIIPEYVIEIPEETFCGCQNLKTVIFQGESKLRTIQSRSFANCKSLQPFIIPQSVESIATDSFFGCEAKNLPLIKNESQMKSMIDNLIIDEKVTQISKEYEDYCNIESLEIPLSIEKIEREVLKSYHKLRYVKCNPTLLNYFQTSLIKIVFIPDGIKELHKKDFDSLINLKFIEIPDSVDVIEKDIFESCKDLTTIKCSLKHFHYLNTKMIKILILNDEVKQINLGDFDGLIDLENCELPEAIEINDQNVFVHCKKLTKINNANAQTLINNKMSVKNGTTSILKEQFKNWSNLKFLNIPKTVVSIENNTFDDCINLEYLICDPKWFPFISKSSIRKIQIPEFVTEIFKGQFDEFYSLTTIELHDGVKVNDPCIFDKCESLAKIQCNSSLFETFSEKTRKRCIFNQKVEFVKPVYDFVDSIKEFQSEGETSIDDLATFDKNNDKYCHSIMNIRGYTHSGKIPKDYRPENSDLSEITKICGAVCHEIHTKFDITPRTSQFLSILGLADEILNNNESHGSVGQIKSGEGKTFIITILSIILAKYDRKIDIIVSNLELAKRNQKNQEKYFNLFDIKTSILDQNGKLFESPIVYSTIEIFELFYLHSMFEMNLRDRLFDIVLVDEIDKMFNDEFTSPLYLSNEITYSYSKDILKIVFLLQSMKTTEIIKVLNYFFPSVESFQEEHIQVLKDAALLSVSLTKNFDYCIENGQIIDLSSNLKMNENVERMIEIKESLDIKPFLVPFCQITNNAYLNLYKKIACVTSSFGSCHNEELFKKEYNLNVFKVLPHVSSRLKVTTKSRPTRIKDVYETVINEIMEEREKGRPVLVVWDSFEHANEFMKNKPFLLAQQIYGQNIDLDNYAIENAGNQQAVSIATFDAVNGIDIKLSPDSIIAGGLHIIVPMKLKNQRQIEQAAGRAGRQGQNGSVTFYISENDKFIKSKRNSKEGQNLTIIEHKFVNYIKNNFPWILNGSKRLLLSNIEFPYSSNHSTVLNALMRRIILIINSSSFDHNVDSSKSLFLEMIRIVWSVFFSRLIQSNEKCQDLNYCNEMYENFLNDLNEWLLPTKSKTIDEAIEYIHSKLLNEIDLDYIIFKGTKISPFEISPIFPDYAKQIELNNGISLSGGELIYRELESGITINWCQILKPFCQFQLIELIDENFIPRTEKVSIQNTKYSPHINQYYNDDDEDEYDSGEIITLKCQQKETWEWIFYNIQDKSKKKSKNKKELKSTEFPDFLTIEFIKTALNLSHEAYSGTFHIGQTIYSNEENEMFKPVFYCLEDSNNLYVITRGSYSKYDWMTDFDCKEIKVDLNGTTIYFHNGFYNSALFVLNSISFLFENKKYEKIFFIGHSYGASVSVILCLLTKMNLNNVFALAFGSAPSMSFCPPEVNSCIFTFINNDDLIPSFSLFNTLNTAAKNHLSFQVFVKLCLIILKPLDNKWIKELVYAIEQNFEIITDIIGILNVKKVKGTVFKIGDNKKTTLNDCIIDESKLPNSLSISLTSLFNHFIDEYEKSFTIIQS